MKRVRCSFNSSATLTQINEFELNSPLSSGTTDTVSISKNNTFSYTDDEGVALQLSITLTADTQSVDLDLLAGELDEVALKDPFGNAITFDKVNLIAISADEQINCDAHETNGFTNAVAGSTGTFILLESADGWLVEDDNKVLVISADSVLVDDDEIVVKVIISGQIVDESSSA